MNTAAVLMILDALLMLAARAPAVALRIRAIREEIDQLKAEGRDPTPDEWEAVGASIDARLERLKQQVS